MRISITMRTMVSLFGIGFRLLTLAAVIVVSAGNVHAAQETPRPIPLL
jgi:hypothetical protein